MKFFVMVGLPVIGALIQVPFIEKSLNVGVLGFCIGVALTNFGSWLTLRI